MGTAQNFKNANITNKKLAATDVKHTGKPFALIRDGSNLESSVDDGKSGTRKTVMFKQHDGANNYSVFRNGSPGSLGVTSPETSAQIIVGFHDIGAGIGNSIKQTQIQE